MLAAIVQKAVHDALAPPGRRQLALLQRRREFALVVPEAVERTAGFTGALTGFLMMLSAFGLRRRFRIAWYATLLLLPLTAAQGLLQASDFSLPLVVASAVAVVDTVAGLPVRDSLSRRVAHPAPASVPTAARKANGANANTGFASAIVGGDTCTAS